ncbi:MAG: 16S rRNA (cytidine(1402)-2'-O)-methyltransferase [Clostridia bacterium]|nr:16S rRNA (cytidine(1402)-2'-O)-methyltransferase [Clostridia bacterium]
MLYIVATPIGNLKEMTFRAVEILQRVDCIAAEDTRHTAVLLNEYKIAKPLVSYQKFNERASAEKLVALLQEGKDVALVSDAGMPLISDPGSVLLETVIAHGLEYTVVSGPCALVNAVVLSGLPTENFLMVGFLPEKAGARRQLVSQYAELPCTLIFYSPPHNVTDDLAFLYEQLGRRRAAVVREISKLHEDVARGYLGDEWTFTVKGEMVIVVEGAVQKSERLTAQMSIEEHIRYYLANGDDKKTAIKKTAADRKIAKSVVYSAALDLKE